MKKANKFLSIILTILMVISTIPITASAATYEGTCGDNLTWIFDESTGTLTISGTGEMYDYKSNNRPWENYEDSIKNVVISNGVTTIGNYALYDCDSLTSVTIGDSVTTIGYRAFSYCSSLTSVTIPDGVTTIGGGAFRYCSSLTSITIPDSVTTIGDSAFSGCSSLESVTLPDSLTSIGWDAFKNTAYYENSSNWDNNVLYIGNHLITTKNAISGSYTIKEGTKIISEDAFYYWNSITSVTIPDSVTTIGKGAFDYCTSLTEFIVDSDSQYYSNDEYGVLFNKDKTTLVQYPDGSTRTNYTIPNSVTTIGDSAFSSCFNLTSIAIPNSVTKIDKYAFGYCSSLTSIEIPNSVTTIELGSFKGCTSLQSMTIPFVGLTRKSNNGVSAVFGYIFDYTSTNTSGTVKQYYSSTDCYYFYIPSSLQSVTITNATQIPSYAFYGCSNLTCITIPDSVKIISEFAFYKCTSLTSVTIPDSVTTIGDKAFQYCTSLTSVTIPDSVTKFGIFAFANCYNLTSISIPNSVTKISNYAFSNCDSLTSISIPDSVTTIGDSAFSGCSSLESITIGENVTSIGILAFSDCSNLTSIMFPDRVTAISAEIFDGCSKLESVIIGAGVTTIDDSAFNACDPTSITVSNNNKYYSSDEYGVLFNKDKTTLIQYPTGNTRTSYIIPDSVTTIGAGSFYGCPNLESVIIGAGVTTIDNSAFGWCGLTSVRIPDSVTTIGERAFYSCYNLETAIICNGVTTIGKYAFSWCDSLTSVTIPISVTKIGDSAFSYCGELENVYYEGTSEQWEKLTRFLSVFMNSYPTIHYNCTPPFTGIKDNHFYKDDVMQKAYQLVTFDGDFYFIGDRHEIVKNKKVYLNEARINGLTYADGTPIAVGYYEFDENGKMIIREGIVGNSIYKNNTMLKAYQLVEVDGDFYYISDRHEFVKNKRVYLKEERINGLTYADGTPISAGYYEFDENGKMIILNGIVGNKIYKNNTMLKAYQLVEIDGDFYYIGDRHEIVKDKKVYLTEAKINGLTYADGTPIAVGYYEFDENGKMIILNGIVGNKIYKNNTMLKAYQLVEIDGDFYFIGDRHEIVKNKQIYLNEDRINGLTYADGTPITTGYHNVDADGKLIIK